MVSYKKLWIKLAELELKKKDLCKIAESANRCDQDGPWRVGYYRCYRSCVQGSEL